MSDDSSTRPTMRVVPKPRRVRFDMPAGTSRQHFVDGDLVMSHFVSTLSATFPEGEDFLFRLALGNAIGVIQEGLHGRGE